MTEPISPRARSRRACRTLAGAIALLVLVSQLSVAAGFSGRRVSEVLDELRSQGFTFIYNTEIVSDDLVVTAEPRATTGLDLAREILGAHGLTLEEVAPRTFAVVREKQKPVVPPATGVTPKPAVPAQSQVEEVVVQTSRYALATDVDGLHAFLDQVQIAHLPRLGDETLQAVQRLPGAAVNGLSSVGPIRGGVPNETAILFDGLRLYEPFHLKNYFSPVSVLDSRIVAGLDVYFGGFPVNYGDRMSAIIDMRSVVPDLPRYYELGLSLFHASGLAYGEFDDGRADLLLSARRSNLGELAQLAENDVGKPEYADGFARLRYVFSDTTRGSLSSLLSHDRIRAVRSSDTERAQDESSNVYTWATLEHDWSEDFDSRLIVSLTNVSDERHGVVDDPGRRTGDVVDERTFGVVGLRIDNELRDGWLTQRFGAEIRRLWADYEYAANVNFAADFPFPGSPPRIEVRQEVLHPDGYEASGYWDARLDINRLWTVQGGLRVDTQTYDGSGDSAQWSPRVSVLYNAGRNTQLRASWGRFYQSQGINELQVEDGVTRFYPVQHANHSIFSIEHTFAKQLDVRVELYRKDYRTVNPRFENLFNPVVLLPELEFDRVRIAPETARTDGVEVWLNWHPEGNWSGWLSYTWSQAQDRVDGEDVYRSWDQRHAASMGIEWVSGPWAATLADTFHTGWPTTQLSLAASPAPGDPPVVIGPRNAVRFDDFNSLDLRITRTFTLRHGELDTFVEVTNLTSRQNPCCTDYSIVQDSGGNPVLVADANNWLPLVPSIGVLWRYGRK
ncbi:MAG TPA: TonB-dependent receptor [Povalibacter sp.]|nr:TonB-dependent receptor [Povalibacter sp.]